MAPPAVMPKSAGASGGRDAEILKRKSPACRERGRKRHCRDREGEAQRLDHVLPVEIERAEIGHGGNGEHACRGGD